MKKLIILFAVIIVFVALFSIGTRKKIDNGAKDILSDVKPVVVTTVKRKDIESIVSFVSTIRGYPEVFVFPKVTGKFLGFSVKEGSRVENGDIIATIEREVPGLEFEPYPVESPINGIVNLLPIDRGQMVTPQTPVAKVAEIKKVKAVFYLPEKYIGKIKRGDKVLAEGREGKIIWLSSFLDSFSRTLEVHSELNNSDLKFLPGMAVNIELVVEYKKDALVIPIDCLLGEVSKYVFVVRDAKAIMKEVKTGIVTDEWVEIKEGLEEGDRVVYIGQKTLTNGDKLNIKEEKNL